MLLKQMEKKDDFCYNCGKTLNYRNEDDCWSTAFKVSFDTLLKVKNIMKGNCLCSECLQELLQKEK